mmetsp:Transcript_49775/g.130915  ORF Transcript_49775/g.130915 Transcript_49775/m.130915 type:complete len:173 (-) Transcript_49775:1478-1996(-)
MRRSPLDTPAAQTAPACGQPPESFPSRRLGSNAGVVEVVSAPWLWIAGRLDLEILVSFRRPGSEKLDRFGAMGGFVSAPWLCNVEVAWEVASEYRDAGSNSDRNFRGSLSGRQPAIEKAPSPLPRASTYPPLQLHGPEAARGAGDEVGPILRQPRSSSEKNGNLPLWQRRRE